ncbi:hypothetical protein [Riemerella columbipharyngis]|uniref:Uncharacterized protein n=1 Tax=Riemerella columbipharyngis TaxID=1071918 RepID=A0A1G7EYL8_9FLAO|nr:hypothetical protein [Riemerella columbipharyngis]SDE68741.1 hypothetical protein SAMN05421544_11825 [Riemerella columbipharyngis]
MGQSFYGSINFDKLMEHLKKGELKTFKTDKGVRLINVNVYIADDPDQFGNDGSISVPLKEEFHQDKIKAVFIGNLKKSTPKITEATKNDFQDDEYLPF